MSNLNDQLNEPTREQLEAHVVAMLLGETSSFEEAQIRERIKQDESLVKFCVEIEKTLHLLSDAMDSGQVDKAKPTKARLDRKRPNSLKKLFAGAARLAKRDVATPNFGRALWGIAAVLAILFVAFGVVFSMLPVRETAVGLLKKRKSASEVQSSMPMPNEARTVSENMPVTATVTPTPATQPEPLPVMESEPAPQAFGVIPNATPPRPPTAEMPPASDFPVGKLWILFLVLVGLGLVRAVAPKNA